MAIKDVIASTGIDFSSFSTGSFQNVFTGMMVFLIAAAILGSLVFSYLRRKQYDKTIEIYSEINGSTSPIGADKAKEVIIPGTSIRAFFLKKRKIYLPRPSTHMGRNNYVYFIRKDGEWINIGFGNLNEDMKKLNLLFDHTDMRMANQTLKDLIDVNYGNLTFLQKYAPYIAVGILVFMLFIGGYMFMRESNKTVAGMASAADTMGEIADKLDNIIGKADNINSQSGIRPALTLSLLNRVGT